MQFGSINVRSASPILLVSALLGLLGLSRLRFEESTKEAENMLDSMRVFYSALLAGRDSALAAGDTLPGTVLVAAGESRILLSELPGAGYRWLYFHREDCPACAFLRPFLDSLRSVESSTIAWIAFARSRILPQPSLPHHFTVVAASDSPIPPLVWVVPQLVRVSSSGRVVGVAAGVDGVARLLGAHGLVDNLVVERALARARAAATASDALGVTP